jgi:uncharacterized integral membrane protein
MKRRFFFSFFWILLNIFVVESQTYDHLKVSLLTVEPRADKVYTIYGHTALRLSDSFNHIDIVLNWGTFNFQAPNFLYRFLKGETDYFLSTNPYGIFYALYSQENATIIEQLLDIPDTEKEALIEAVAKNLERQNLEYRYDFLFDNCSTRPRDYIEKFCGGQLIYSEQDKKTTFRNLIHSCSDPYPWMTFGIDLLVGSGADSLISTRHELFLPIKLMEVLDRSTVLLASTGEKRPLVVSSKVILQSSDTQIFNYHFWNRPVITGFIFFFFCLFLAFWGGKKRKKIKWIFAFLFLAASMAGCLIGFITVFSYHPCTSPNWNLLWLHPFHLIAFTGYFFKKSYCFIYWYHRVNLLLLCCLFLGWHWIPQELNTACIPFILSLGLASGYGCKTNKQRNKK